jgi:hypothetical protein
MEAPPCVPRESETDGPREENADDLIIHLFVTHFGGRRVIRTKAVGGGVFLCVWARERERAVLVWCVACKPHAQRRAVRMGDLPAGASFCSPRHRIHC